MSVDHARIVAETALLCLEHIGKSPHEAVPVKIAAVVRVLRDILEAQGTEAVKDSHEAMLEAAKGESSV